MNVRAVGFWLGLLVAVIAVAAYTGTRARDGAPFDPRSTGPLGTHALVAFLEEFGADVERDLPDASIPRTLLLDDNLNGQRRAALQRWVEAGGTLVVTDTSSPFVPEPSLGSEFTGSLDSGVCTLDGLEDLTIEASSFSFFDTVGAVEQCFGRSDETFVHVRNEGRGQIVSLGGGLALTNQNLDEAENAVLAAELLLGDTPRPIAVIFAPFVPEERRSVSDVIPSGAKWSAWQLIVAIAVFIAWRARRFGHPVDEPQAVELPASLLVRAVGELRRRSGGSGAASIDLRQDLDRRLRAHTKAPPDMPFGDLVVLTATETGLDPGLIERALNGPPALDAQHLAALVGDIDEINTALVRRRAAAEGAIDTQPVGGST